MTEWNDLPLEYVCPQCGLNKEAFALYEEIKKSDRVNSAGRDCYVERNYWMIGESDFAIFHLDENNNTKKSDSQEVFASFFQLF